MAGILDLWSLQGVDDEIAAMRVAMAELDRRLLGDEELLAAREIFAASQAELDAARRTQRTIEAEVADVTARIDRDEKKLYGETGSNAKEAGKLLEEVNHLKQARSDMEDRLLAAIEGVETVSATHAVNAKRVNQLEARWMVASEGMRAELAALGRTLAGKEAVRAAQAASIPRAQLALYEALRTRRGSAVARLHGFGCGGCRVNVPEATRRRVTGATSPVQCPHCDRILVP